MLLLAETGIIPELRDETGAPPGSLTRSGLLPANLRKAGVEPGDIDAVFVSHGHPDHLGALLDGEGRKMFPNARVFYDRRDYDHHAGPTATSTEARRLETEVARQALAVVRDVLELTDPGDAIAPGVTVVDAAGHTPGHCGLMIGSEGERLFHSADVGAHHVLSLRHPDWPFIAAVDPVQEVATRQRLLAMAADERLRVFACHFPFPNLGHIARDGEGYRWVPEPWAWR